MGDAAAVADYIAAILTPRLSERRVTDMVELIYSRATSNVSELAQYAKQPKSNPYRAKREPQTLGQPQTDRIICGGHPWLCARKVSELQVSSSEVGFERVSWKEPDEYIFDPDGPKMVHNSKGKRRVHTRQVLGRLLDDAIWDRIGGQWIEGYGAPDV